MIWKLKGRMHKGGYYDVEKKSVGGKGGITGSKFKGRMELKGKMEKGAL